MHDDINTKRTELANQMAAAGAANLDFTGTAAVLAAIPDTEPQQYVAAGTPENIAAILPATISPARRMRHGDRPTEALVFDEPAATSGDAPADDQWMFDLAAEYESRGNGLYGPVTFDAQQLPEFVKAILAHARIERTTANAQPVNTSSERVENAAGNEQVERAAAPAPQGLAKQFGYPAIASGATASGDELPPLPDFFALGKTRINGVEHGHYSASQMHAYARAAVSAATKPTADLSKLTTYTILGTQVGLPRGAYEAVLLSDVQSLLATKPAGVPNGWSIELGQDSVPGAQVVVRGPGGTMTGIYRNSASPADKTLIRFFEALAATPAASTTGAAQTAEQVRNDALEEAASVYMVGAVAAREIRKLKRPTPTHSSEAGDAS